VSLWARFSAAVFATNSAGLRKIANNSSKVTSRMLIDPFLLHSKEKCLRVLAQNRVENGKVEGLS
jgi:hypothetical protein